MMVIKRLSTSQLQKPELAGVAPGHAARDDDGDRRAPIPQILITVSHQRLIRTDLVANRPGLGDLCAVTGGGIFARRYRDQHPSIEGGKPDQSGFPH
jgi:hypothetical protein